MLLANSGHLILSSTVRAPVFVRCPQNDLDCILPSRSASVTSLQAPLVEQPALCCMTCLRNTGEACGRTALVWLSEAPTGRSRSCVLVGLLCVWGLLRPSHLEVWMSLCPFLATFIDHLVKMLPDFSAVLIPFTLWFLEHLKETLRDSVSVHPVPSLAPPPHAWGSCSWSSFHHEGGKTGVLLT